MPRAQELWDRDGDELFSGIPLARVLKRAPAGSKWYASSAFRPILAIEQGGSGGVFRRRSEPSFPLLERTAPNRHCNNFPPEVLQAFGGPWIGALQYSFSDRR